MKHEDSTIGNLQVDPHTKMEAWKEDIQPIIQVHLHFLTPLMYLPLNDVLGPNICPTYRKMDDKKQ